MTKSIPIIREWESEAFILGNGREREFPLTPAIGNSFLVENQSYQHKSDVLQGTILLTLMKINAQHLNQDIAFY